MAAKAFQKHAPWLRWAPRLMLGVWPAVGSLRWRKTGVEWQSTGTHSSI